MIKEIRYGITNALYKMFGDYYNIYIDNVEQGYKNPCFFVSLVDWYSDPMIMGREKVHTQYNITFFPEHEDEPTDECYEMIQKLKQCLRMIETENGDIFRGIDMDAKVVDGLLQFYVTYNFETIESENGNYMESYTERTKYGR